MYRIPDKAYVNTMYLVYHLLRFVRAAYLFSIALIWSRTTYPILIVLFFVGIPYPLFFIYSIWVRYIPMMFWICVISGSFLLTFFWILFTLTTLNYFFEIEFLKEILSWALVVFVEFIQFFPFFVKFLARDMIYVICEIHAIKFQYYKDVANCYFMII